MTIRFGKIAAPRATVAVIAVVILSGCASTGNPKDPLEGFNRAVFSINEGIDQVAIKPAAKAYDYALPTLVRTGVSNFFSNIEDVFVGVNNFLQGKPREGAGDLARVVVNSTVGVLGVVDMATDMGLPKHEEDFGQTLGWWGTDTGAYLVLPLLGPRTVRDAVGLAVDSYVDPVSNIDHVPTRNSFSALRIINTRAELLPADKVVEEAALDKYAYIRDGYLQRRRSLIHDGNPPRDIAEE